MQTRVPTKGQIVLPGQLRRQLGIRAGDPLDVTQLPVLSAGINAPALNSKDVDEILSNFP